MRFFSSAHCFLILLTITATTGSDPVEVKVKLHESATLPCSGNCSGLMQWTLEHDPFFILAQCDQTSCHSKKRVLISHDQYLNGNFSLHIPDADLGYIQRMTYTCLCYHKIICTVDLQVESDQQPGLAVWAKVLIFLGCLLLALVLGAINKACGVDLTFIFSFLGF